MSLQVQPETMAEDERREAWLPLKILNAEGLNDTRFLGRGKMKTLIVAWIDPRFKKSTKTLTTSSTNPNYNYNLSFSPSLQTLQNPNSCLTFQILYSSSPIHRERVIGTAVMPLTSLRVKEEVFTLQVWRPSGRAYGLLRVTARIECNVHFCPPPGFVTGIPVEDDSVQSSPLILADIPPSYAGLVPSAPYEDVDLAQSFSVHSSVPLDDGNFGQMPQPPMMIRDRMASVESSTSTCSSEFTSAAPPIKPPDDGANVLKSLLVGVLGGAVAVATVLVGSNTS